MSCQQDTFYGPADQSRQLHGPLAKAAPCRHRELVVAFQKTEDSTPLHTAMDYYMQL